MLSFYVMTFKGFSVLHEVVESFGTDLIDCVIAERDSALDKDYYDEIRDLCLQKNIRFFNRKEQFTIESNYSVLVSWRWMIHDDSRKLIVLHDSLLPKYRGFNPLVTALINGDQEIGVTALYATEDFDRGDIIYQSSVTISYPIKIKDAIEKVVACYVSLVKSVCQDLLNGKQLPSKKQDDEEASYSIWRDEQDYLINWELDAGTIKRTIDALGFPYRGAKSYVGENEIRILEAEIEKDMDIVNRTPGKVITIKENCPLVVCGKGILRITKMVDRFNVEYHLSKMRVRFT